MKTFLILFAVIGLIGLGLWLKHKSDIFYHEKKEDFKPAEVKPSLLPASFTPEELASFIHLSRDEIVSNCIDKAFTWHRVNVGMESKFICQKSVRLPEDPFHDFTNEEVIVSDTTNKISYVIKNKTTYQDFISTLRTHSKTFNMEEEKVENEYHSKRQYLLGDCIFTDYGYHTGLEGYCIFLLPERAIKLKNNNNYSLVKPDSLEKTRPIIAYINTDNCILQHSSSDYNYVMIDSERKTLPKRSQVEVLRQKGGALFCRYTDENGKSATAWICKRDISYSKTKVSHRATHYRVGSFFQFWGSRFSILFVVKRCMCSSTSLSQ